MNTWERFWAWYEKHTTKSLFITAVWNADLYLQAGLVSNYHPVLDFFLYGVDLIEIIPMISISMMIFSKVRKWQA